MNEHERHMQPEDIARWDHRLEGIVFTENVQQTYGANGIDVTVSWSGTQTMMDVEGNTIAITFKKYPNNSVFWEMEWKDIFISAYFDNTAPAVDISHASIRGAISISFDKEIKVAGSIPDPRFDHIKSLLKNELSGRAVDFEAFSVALTEPSLWMKPTQADPIVERIVGACLG